jgi:DNA-binding CsgD family transcriptional regulator
MMLESSKSAWDKASIGIIVVNPDGRVEFLNRMADEFIKQDYGLVLRNGVISTAASESAKIMAERIRQATQLVNLRTSDAESVLRVSHVTGSMLMILVVSLPVYAVDETRLPELQAMLMITDPYRERNLLGRHLVDWFGLTQAEAALAVQLANGAKLGSVAQAKRVNICTLRSQLSAILSKTGTERQSDLIRLLHQLPTAYWGDSASAKSVKDWGDRAYGLR